MKSFLEMLGEAEQNPQFMKDKASVEVQPSSKGDSPVKKKTSKDLPKNKTIGGDTPNKIEIEPEYITRMDGMKESVQRTVVFSFGRMNPPTVGHQKLVDKIVSVAKKNNGDAKVFLSRTEGNAKNPIPYSKKIKFAKIAFPGVVNDTPKNMLPPGYLGILKTLEDKYDHAIIVVGSDRVQKVKTYANQYNGIEYNFKSIEVVSAGERDPDEEGVGGMSASKMRAAVASDDFDSFKGGLPAKLRGLAKTVYDAVSETISESLDEAVLTTSQRLKRRAQMRRFKGKIRMGQKRAIRRKATNVTIKKRSRRIAIKLMRKRILRGRNYNDLSLSSRQSVDRIVARRKAAIGRIAKRVEPKLRQAESRRKAGTGYKSISLGAPPSKKKKLKESLLVDWSGNNIIPSVTTLLDKIAEETSLRLSMLEQASLAKKAHESGESLDTIRQVFDRGVAAWHAGLREGSTPQQWGFARVNSFIHNGYSARTADSDLIEQQQTTSKKHETIAKIARKEATSKTLAGHLKNSDSDIADAARKALEKRRDTGDKEAGKHMDKAESDIQASQKPAPLAVPSAGKMGLSTAKALLKARGAKVPTFEAFCEATKVPAGPNAGLGNEPTVNAKPVHHKSSVHKFHMHHMTNPNLPLKHQIKHAEDRKDIDVDGDTDAFDKPNSGVPDEVPVPTAKTNRAFLKKYAKEHEHTHAGEPVDESDHKYTTNEDDWYLDAAGNKVRVMHDSDLKEPEDVAKYLRDKNKDDNFGKVMSMKDFLKTQPDKKVEK